MINILELFGSSCKSQCNQKITAPIELASWKTAWRIRIRNNERDIETSKEKDSKLKHDMSQKEILINSLTGKLNEERTKQMWQTSI